MLMFSAQWSYRIRVIGGGLGFDVTAEPEVGDFLRLESVVEAAEGVPVDKDLQEIRNSNHFVTKIFK